MVKRWYGDGRFQARISKTNATTLHVELINVTKKKKKKEVSKYNQIWIIGNKKKSFNYIFRNNSNKIFSINFFKKLSQIYLQNDFRCI